MSIGDHLDELRSRLVRGMIGFVIAFAFWMVMGKKALAIFCRPLQIALARNGLPQKIYFTDVAEPFMVYIRVSLILALVLASPWLLYQLWQFVAAGLYPKERKYITKYLPLSIALLISGMLFLYFYVLPLMLEFFLIFHIADIPPLAEYGTHTSLTATTQPAILPIIDNDPSDPAVGAIWMNRTTGQLMFNLGGPKGEGLRVISFGSASLTTPIITIGTYIDMVMGMLASFGIAFQMPLVVLALNKIGIVEIEMLKKARRVVYFGMSIVAACIVPDVATGMIALLIPLILLYEFGIILASWSRNKTEADVSAT